MGPFEHTRVYANEVTQDETSRDSFMGAAHPKNQLFFFFYFIFKLYKIVLVLPNIKMNPPQLYITFLPRSKRLLISWLQSPSAVIGAKKK